MAESEEELKSLLMKLKKKSEKVGLKFSIHCVDHNKLWKILKEIGILSHLNWSWESFMQIKKQQLEPDMK